MIPSFNVSDYLVSCSFSELLSKTSHKKTHYIGSVYDSTSLELKLKALTKYTEYLVLGFDKANTHLYGIQLDVENVLECINKLTQIHLSQVYSCMFQNKHILLLEFGVKQALPTDTNDVSANKSSIPDLQSKPKANTVSKESKLILNSRQKKTVTYLRNHKKITNRKFRDLFGVSHKTAHLELLELVEEGWIQRIGSGRSTRYQRQ